MNIVDLANEALAVQTACNLSGVVYSFSKAMTSLWEIGRNEGWANTNTINSHPVAILFADKIARLVDPCSSLNGTVYFKAYNWAKEVTTSAPNA
jgi:hypothetical protein